MSQVMPYLGYPGGCSAFFTDLHLDFPRWLRLVALVPLVHASIEGLSYEELCFHLLGIFPSSNSPNVLIVSAGRIRSSVAEMLLKEPFFVCSLSDNGLSLSTSRWAYESSFDSDPSRISFAFSILRCINLSPGLSVRDTLSILTSAALPPNLSNFVSNESRGRQESQSLYDEHGYSPPHNPPTPAVRVFIPSLTGPSAHPARAGLNSFNQQKSRLSSVLGSITFDSPQPRGLPYGSTLVPMGSTASGEFLHPDTVSSHLSQSHELPRRFCGTPELSGTNPHLAEDNARDSYSQHKAPTTDFPGLSSELPGQLSDGRYNSFGNSYAKIPLFLPTQTPNCDSSRDILSSQGSTLTHDGRRLLQGSPIRCIPQPQTDCTHSDLLHTSALRHVETEIHSGDEREIPRHDNGSLPRTFASTKPTLPLQWPDGPTTDPFSPGGLNHGSPHCQSAGLSNARGSVNQEAIPTGVFQAQCDTELTSAPKRMRRSMTPVQATALDVPFSPFALDRKALTLSPLNLRNSSKHEELALVDQRRTPLNPQNNDSQIPHLDGSCTLSSPSSSGPRSGPRGSSSFQGTSRPSVIVYKVATGPNLSGSRDVIRVSYGEGHRKRTPLANLGNRCKERTPSRGNAKRNETTEHLNRNPIRSKLCSTRRYYDKKRSPSGMRRAEIKMLGTLPPAERVEGDMAWNFGVGPETCVRTANADRSRVRVGGLTSVRMVPRTAVNSGIGPEV